MRIKSSVLAHVTRSSLVVRVVPVVLPLVITLFLLTIARATPLPPGQSVVPNDTVSPSGAHLVASLTGPFNDSVMSGFLKTSVFDNDPNNPNGPAALTFVYVLNNNPNDVGFHQSFARLSLFPFPAVTLDAAIGLASLPTDYRPPTVNRTAEGSTVRWEFGPNGADAIPPGSRSAMLVLRSNATIYGLSGVEVTSSGGANAIADAYTYVPEPGSAALLVLLVSAGFIARTGRR
jgi:hypothetical protein